MLRRYGADAEKGDLAIAILHSPYMTTALQKLWDDSVSKVIWAKILLVCVYYTFVSMTTQLWSHHITLTSHIT